MMTIPIKTESDTASIGIVIAVADDKTMKIVID